MLYKRKIAFTAIIVLIAYALCLALYPNKNAIASYVIDLSTTTTTTPTPLDILKQFKYDPNKNITIEKYDALKVHTSIMKKKILRMTQSFPKPPDKLDGRNNVININVHMLYSDHVKKIVNMKDKKMFNSSSIYNNRLNVIEENMKAAHDSGAGVLYIEYPYISMLRHLQATDDILKIFFNLAPKYNLKISMLIKDYYERSTDNIRRNIIGFIKTFGNDSSLFTYKSLPVFYIMDSYTISHEKWRDILSPDGIDTIRRTRYDAVILGHLRDEEHNVHVRRSYFDGFFTCCNNNGDTFGSTWKNWQSLSLWAKSHDLIWSAGVIEGTSRTMTMKAALNTLLRCDPSPTFVFFSQMNFDDDIVSLAQRWTKIWSNKSQRDKQYLT